MRDEVGFVWSQNRKSAETLPFKHPQAYPFGREEDTDAWRSNKTFKIKKLDIINYHNLEP